MSRHARLALLVAVATVALMAGFVLRQGGSQAPSADPAAARELLAAELPDIHGQKQRLEQASAQLKQEAQALEQEGRELSQKAQQIKAEHTALEQAEAALKPRIDQMVQRHQALERRRESIDARRPRLRNYDVAAFNREVERYNLMLVYPNGIDKK